MAKYDEDNYGSAVPRERTRRDDWIDSDIEAEEKEKKRKGRPIQKPPRKKKRQGRKDVEELEMAMAGPALGPLPWKGIPPWKENPKPTKKGGRVRGYSSGGKVHRAGLARRRRS